MSDHYEQAEEILASTGDLGRGLLADRTLLAAAQVHASLALADRAGAVLDLLGDLQGELEQIRERLGQLAAGTS